jgi:D-glycero-alpha-D-manno-heptose-7-phosphate kinase
VRVVSRDRGSCEQAEQAEQLARSDLRLPAALVRAITPHQALELELESGVPPGSGLGGSSSLAVAAAAALWAAVGRVPRQRELIRLVQDVETAVLGVLTGRQDYGPAVWGGLTAFWWQPGAERRQALPVEGLAEHLVLVDTGETRCSGANNWQVARARLDGNAVVTAQLEGIREAAVSMAHALARADMEGAGLALAQEWSRRRQLTPRISTPRLEGLVSLARAAGAWGAKVCGAGGGGALVAFGPPDKRAAIAASLEQAGARRLAFEVESEGLTVERLQEDGGST